MIWSPGLGLKHSDSSLSNGPDGRYPQTEGQMDEKVRKSSQSQKQLAYTVEGVMR